MTPNSADDDRAVSPVVSVALLIGITVILTAVIGVVVFDLDLGSAQAPEATLSFAVVGDDVELTHEGGDRLEASEITVLDEDGNELDGLDDDLVTGESEVIAQDVDSQNIERIRVVWNDPDGDSGAVLAEFKL